MTIKRENRSNERVSRGLDEPRKNEVNIKGVYFTYVGQKPLGGLTP